MAPNSKLGKYRVCGQNVVKNTRTVPCEGNSDSWYYTACTNEKCENFKEWNGKTSCKCYVCRLPQQSSAHVSSDLSETKNENSDNDFMHKIIILFIW